MRILVVDNYDSFTYNLVHLLHAKGYKDQTDVFRNDKLTLAEAGKYDKILLSPGPGLPAEAGLMPAIIKEYAPTKSILGICLGHQAIGEAFGARLCNLPDVLHGVADQARLLSADEPLFRGLPLTFGIAHYHSWVVAHEGLPESLLPLAVDEQGHLMAIRHKTYNVQGLQFHPESVLTEHGATIIGNWLSN